MKISNVMMATAVALMMTAAEPPRDTRDEKALDEARRIRREREEWMRKNAAERQALRDAAAEPYRIANRARRARHIARGGSSDSAVAAVIVLVVILALVVGGLVIRATRDANAQERPAVGVECVLDDRKIPLVTDARVIVLPTGERVFVMTGRDGMAACCTLPAAPAERAPVKP